MFRAHRGVLRERATAWLLWRTSSVMARIRPGLSGTSTTWTEPLIIEPLYCVPGSTYWQSGSWLVAPQRLGPAPESLVLTTTSFPPSGVTATDDGYQLVGMKPWTARLATSTTATAFSPASAT
jgi:hypothetical protein